MRLAKLTMHGFKSFADRTELRFDDPIIGIVGPNGCGKSNVVDAVKWVLGERSAKSLRGEQMMDVIFGGTTARKPAQTAEVILTFENPIVDPESDQREMALDTELVEIGRRLHRDGTSEYLINNKKSRLKDIRDIFLDTGIGSNAYSIIEQGKVESMLTSNPQERRLIFEEAAGVAKFKVRRIEAQRKLERTEINLVRCREKLDSAERRLRTIHRQAEKARQFKVLDSELSELRRAHAFDAYYQLRQRIDGLTSEVTHLDDERNELTEELANREDAKQDAELKRHHLQNELREIEQDRLRKTARRDQAVQRAEMARAAREKSQSEIASDRERLLKLEQNLTEINESLAAQAEEIAELQEQQQSAEQAVEQAVRDRNESDDEVNDARKTLAEKRTIVAGIEREQSSLESQFDGLNHRITAVQEQLRDILRRLTELDQRNQEVQSEITESNSRANAMGLHIQSLENEVKQQDQQADSLSGRQRDASDELNQLVQERERLDARRMTLQEMQDAGEGLADAVRNVLDKRELGEGFEFVRGILADVIRTDVDHAAAVEAALGSLLQSVIIFDLNEVINNAPEVINQLTGRVTFLPVNPSNDEDYVAVEVGPHGENQFLFAIDETGLVRPELTEVASLVDCDSALRPVMNRLLHGTYLVDDLATGARLLEHLPKNARLVTRAGEVLLSDGRVMAGPNGGTENGAGILIRRTELLNLEACVDGLDEIISQKRHALAEIDQRAADLERARADLQQQLYAQRSERDRTLHLKDRLNDERNRLLRERPALEEERDNLTHRIESITGEKQQKSDRLESLKRLLLEEQQILDTVEKQVTEKEQALERINNRLTDLRISAGQAVERLAALQREQRRLDNARNDLAEHKNRLESAIKERLEGTLDHDRLIDEAAFECEECEQFLTNSAQQLDTFRNDLEECSTVVVALAQSVNAARERMSIVERNLHAVELSKREAEVKREELEQRILDDLAINLCEEYENYLDKRKDEDFEKLDVHMVKDRIEYLRNEIRKLGNVNLDAVVEEEELEHQHDDLAAQVADLDEARGQLEVLIDELNEASRDRFRITFEAVREHFAGNEGMFRKLFGGGRADIVLLPVKDSDEIDWLESGVDIIAKPPGKETRSISLLSGGEKTMTSVALLMAIFQSKPSPFCILDEVDAALDEANVRRFVHVVRSFLDKSHFIIITHNKQAMQVADRLYGITMQERGVSTRVAVRFDQVSSDGRIVQEAVTKQQTKTRSNNNNKIESDTIIEAKSESAPAPGKQNGLSQALAKMRSDAEIVEITNTP